MNAAKASHPTGAVRLALTSDQLAAKDALKALQALLASAADSDRPAPLPGLPGLPKPVWDLWVAALAWLAQGSAVLVVPTDAELTTGEAAQLLGISRPTMVKLLEDGLLAHHKVGERRRIMLADVLAYRQTRDDQAEQRGGAASHRA